MQSPSFIAQRIIETLAAAEVTYTLYDHRAALTYEDLDLVRQETGFQGTEMKCLVLKADGSSVVYVTLQGNRFDTKAFKETGVKKVRFVTAEELQEEFSAQPGCAYPFGFESSVPIFVDPAIFDEELLVFSPAVPTQTVQVAGKSLRNVFDRLENTVTYQDFNQVVSN